MNDTQHDHDDRDNQENVDEPAYCVRGNQTQYPEDDKDDSNRFKHFCFSENGSPFDKAQEAHCERLQLQFSDLDPRQPVQNSECTQQPQNHRDDDHDIEYLFDARIHRYVGVDHPQQQTDNDQ